MSKRSRPKKRSNPSSDPPSNMRLMVDPDRTEIVYTSRLWFRGFQLAVFASLWNGFLGFVAFDMIFKGTSWSMLLFMIPFYLVGILLVGFLLRCFLHRETIVLDKEGFNWTLSVIVPILRRRVPWERRLRVRKGSCHGYNRVVESWGAIIENCRSKPFSIFLDMPTGKEENAARQFLSRQIQLFRTANDLPDHSGDENETELRQRGFFELRYFPDAFEIYRRPFANMEERFFFKFFFIFWSAGLIFMTFAMVNGLLFDKNPRQLPVYLFGSLIVSVAWLVELVLGIGLLGRHHRWETLRIDSAGVRYTERVWLTFLLVNVTWRKRFIPIDELGLAFIYRTEKENGIELTSTGKPLRCFSELLYMTNPNVLIKPLNEQLAKFGVTERIRQEVEYDSNEPLRIGRWKIVDDGMTKILSRRGWIDANLFFSQLFVLFFWGVGTIIVTIACVVLTAAFKAYLLIPAAVLFLTPFIGYSIILVLGTTTMFLQFFCRYRIVIDGENVQCRRSWFGIGRARRWPHDRIGKAIVHKIETPGNFIRQFDFIRNPEAYEPNDRGEYPTTPYVIRIIGKDDPDKQTGAISDLYKNEAHAIAETIRRQLQDQ